MGQQLSIDIADVFQFELNPVPPALIDKYGCLRKGDKAVLVKSLSVSVTTLCAPNVVLIDAGQLLYHVIWPISGTVIGQSRDPRSAPGVLNKNGEAEGEAKPKGALQFCYINSSIVHQFNVCICHLCIRLIIPCTLCHCK